MFVDPMLSDPVMQAKWADYQRASGVSDEALAPITPTTVLADGEARAAAYHAAYQPETPSPERARNEAEAAERRAALLQADAEGARAMAREWSDGAECKEFREATRQAAVSLLDPQNSAAAVAKARERAVEAMVSRTSIILDATAGTFQLRADGKREEEELARRVGDRQAPRLWADFVSLSVLALAHRLFAEDRELLRREAEVFVAAFERPVDGSGGARPEGGLLKPGPGYTGGTTTELSGWAYRTVQPAAAPHDHPTPALQPIGFANQPRGGAKAIASYLTVPARPNRPA